VYDLLFVKSWDTRFSDHSVLDFHVDASATYLVGLCPGHRRLLQHGGIPAGMATRGKIYKNADLSAFLYLCLNKSSCLAEVGCHDWDWDARKYGKKRRKVL